MDVHMKSCSRCGLEKQLHDFYCDARGVFSARCRHCHGISLRKCRVCNAQFEGSSRAILCSEECRSKHRPKTVKCCLHCDTSFEVPNLSVVFCSRRCGYAWKRAQPKRPRMTKTRAAARAQRTVAYHISVGHLQRPANCEQCFRAGKIEAAHYDYAKPLVVRWLCVSCHRAWDRVDPKGGVLHRSSELAADRGVVLPAGQLAGAA